VVHVQHIHCTWAGKSFTWQKMCQIHHHHVFNGKILFGGNGLV
jgi:hypothetical protein